MSVQFTNTLIHFCMLLLMSVSMIGLGTAMYRGIKSGWFSFSSLQGEHPAMVVAQSHQPEESNMEYFTVGNSIIHYDELFDELLAVTSKHIDMNPKYISPTHFGIAVVPVVNGMVDDNVIPPYYKDEVLYKVWDYVFYLSDTSSF